MDGSLLFVYKTQTSPVLPRSKAGEQAAILSHVQHNRRKNEAEASKQLKPWSRFVTILPTSKVSTGLETVAKKLEFVTFVEEARPKKQKVNFLFESFAPLNMFLQPLLTRHDATFKLRLRRCVKDEKLMYSNFAYGSSLLGWMMGRFDSTKQPEYFLDKALRAVRNYLATAEYKVDDWLLLSMYALAVTEMWNGMAFMWKHMPWFPSWDRTDLQPVECISRRCSK